MSRASSGTLRALPAALFLVIVAGVVVAVMRIHGRAPAPVGDVLPTVSIAADGTPGDDGAAASGDGAGGAGTRAIGGARGADDRARFPRTVTAWDGTSFTLDAPPRRIVPAGASLIDSVEALLGLDAIAGIPEQAAEYSVLDTVDPALWRDLPTFARYTAEPILALAPDLVLVSPWQAIETTEILVGAGVPVVTMPDAASWPEQLDVLQRLGEILGAETRAQELAARLEARRAALEATAPARAGLRAMTYTNFGTGGWTAGAGTHPDTILRLAGLRNASAEAGRDGHTPIDFEQILALDPDLIVVGGPPTARLLREEPVLSGLRAVREQRIVVIAPSLMGAASHRLLDAAEVLARAVDALGS